MCGLNEFRDLLSEEQLQALQDQGITDARSLVSLWVTPRMEMEIADLLAVPLEQCRALIDQITARSGDFPMTVMSEEELAERLGCLESPEDEIHEKGGESNVEADDSVDEADQPGSE